MAFNRVAILRRDRFRCRYCGAEPGESGLHVDHVHPRSKGGSDHHLNLVTACERCNREKADTELPTYPCSPTDRDCLRAYPRGFDPDQTRIGLDECYGPSGVGSFACLCPNEYIPTGYAFDRNDWAQEGR